MKRILIAILIIVSANVFAQSLPSGNVEGLNVGNIAPDISMKSPLDCTLTLSSLRGKIVLLDFWASWCAPCRRENPYVLKAYRTYGDSMFVGANGFTVYSVSLDNPGGKSAWTAAIAKDSLSWPYHVSDLMGWSNAAAQKYGIFQIPSNFLIDANGVIVAKNLMDNALEQALATMTDHEKNNKIMKKCRKKKKKNTSSSWTSMAGLREEQVFFE